MQTSLDISEDVPTIEYLAGFFDGEGCFSCRLPDPDKPVQFIVTLSTTKETEACLFEQKFGGSVYMHNPNDGGHSTSWRWRCTGRQAKVVAEQLWPHLRGKKDQCETFVEAITHKLSHHREGRAYPESVIDEMHEYGERVRSFNSAQRRFKEDN